MKKGYGPVKTLKMCRDLWQWLADNPQIFRKSEWPGFKGKPRFLCYCPCCEYATNLDRDCNRCPLLGFAWKLGCYKKGNLLADEINLPCYRAKSPYQRWDIASIDSARKRNALKMVAACDEALAAIRKSRRRYDFR